MPTVLLVRHGQASFGTADYDVLSEVGERQAGLAAAAVERLGYRPTRLLCGTLRRQRDTALAFGGGPEPEVDPRWNEYDSEEVLIHHSESAARLSVGEGAEALDNRSFQLVLEAAVEIWIAAGADSPTAQSWEGFRDAGAGALADLSGGLGSGETAVVVTSGGVIAALVCGVLGSGPVAFNRLNRMVVNGSITKLAVGSTGTNLASFNDHSHLEAVDRSLVTYR
ncbi:MAG TPA: histidine phosphatase family protein [Solirubrobacterales bacterium]|nr:histidine phosphatase family protein [Solirubrobacterales bacterium]